MASDKITIDRELFERLTHAAIELEGEWHWKAGIPGQRYGEALKGVQSLVRESVAIRDAPPQGMTDREREAVIEAGTYELQLQAAAQRLQAVLGLAESVDTMGVVEAVDELIARHAKAIADIREAQGTIVAHIRTSDCHVMIDAWQSGAGLLYMAVDDRQPRTRGVTIEVDPSRCLLVQIAEAIDEWKRINLPATGKSE